MPELYERIQRRVDRMFDDGLLAEVVALLDRGFRAADPGMRGIGYREILEMRRGCDTIAEVRRRIAQATRRYAKRQLTFFRAVPGVCWLSPDDRPAIQGSAGSICRRLRHRGGHLTSRREVRIVTLRRRDSRTKNRKE